MEYLKDKLIEKSKEAFILAIEIYNKPSIKYRVEGFSFFICNAWELMLKAQMVKKFGEESIYYKDNPHRTITLEKCIQKIFTNDKDPLRKNLEKIIDLRNTSTHFITEEYEMVYIPLFQACVFNFIEKIEDFHDIDMTEIIPPNFLTLTISIRSINYDEIRAKYPKEIADKFISLNNEITPIIAENNQHFSINVNHHYYITKDKNKATTIVGIDNTSNSKMKIVKELQDPNNTHKYTCKKCCYEINKRLEKLGITLVLNGNPHKFTSADFNLFCKYYGIKQNPKLCYTYKVHTQPQYSYSLQTIDFIVDEIKKDPSNIINNIKNAKKNKLTPGAKEF